MKEKWQYLKTGQVKRSAQMTCNTWLWIRIFFSLNHVLPPHTCSISQWTLFPNTISLKTWLGLMIRKALQLLWFRTLKVIFDGMIALVSVWINKYKLFPCIAVSIAACIISSFPLLLLFTTWSGFEILPHAIRSQVIRLLPLSIKFAWTK